MITQFKNRCEWVNFWLDFLLMVSCPLWQHPQKSRSRAAFIKQLGSDPNYLAMPKYTAKQRSTSTIASESMRPKAGPTLSRFTVIALSTIT